MQNRNVTVFDLETTGLLPDCGDRITEIGAIKLCGNKLRSEERRVGKEC